VTLTIIEQQILQFLVSVLQANEQGIAQTVIADLVALVDEFIPSGLLSGVIQLIINTLKSDGVAIVQQLLDDIAAAIEAVIPTADAAMQHDWADIHSKLKTAPETLLENIAQIIASYKTKVK